MTFYRTIVNHKTLHISFKDHITNEEVRAKIKLASGPHEDLLTILIIITYIYNALNDALSASRIHNKLKIILSKYIHIQNRQF